MDASIDSTGPKNTFARDFEIQNAKIRSVGLDSTYGLFYKLGNFFVLYSRLLTKSMSEMPIRSFLHSKMVLDQILYCYSTYLIFLRIYLIYHLVVTAFSIAVIQVLLVPVLVLI